MKNNICLLSINNFNPVLCDGVSNSMFELFSNLKEKGFKVSIFNYLTNETYKKSLNKVLFEQVLKEDIVRADDECCELRYKGIFMHQEILPFNENEITVCSQNVLRYFVKTLKQRDIDFIFTLEYIVVALLSVYLAEIPGVHMFHSPGNENIFNQLNKPFYNKILKTRHLFTVSRFLNIRLQKKIGIESHVWNPVIGFKRCYAESIVAETKTVGYYSGGSHKGDVIINRLVEKMPEYRFVVIGRNYTHQFSSMPENLIYLGDCTEVKKFYRQIKLLLIPSLVAETFARISIEAAVNGIPVIANRVGGIPEALGESGILIDVNLNEKIDVDAMAEQYQYHIDRLLNNQDLYREHRGKALQRARQFEEEQKKMLTRFCEKYLQ